MEAGSRIRSASLVPRNEQKTRDCLLGDDVYSSRSMYREILDFKDHEGVVVVVGKSQCSAGACRMTVTPAIRPQ
jgi:hypothetical protein